MDGTAAINGVDGSPLRRMLTESAAELGLSMADLTVLDKKLDPFRIDTPARHRDGRWLGSLCDELVSGTVHLRGLHYILIGRPKPDGTPYTNTADDWLWLVEHAARAARWLGYIPFDRIVDQRNSPPEVTLYEHKEPWPYLFVGLNVEIPSAADIEPQISVQDFDGHQPYKLVLVGEKSSLHDVLAPLAATYRADLYLPTGEMSSTHVYQMARIGAEDGRPMVVLYFADCDPSGWQMPTSVGRKLQAFKALHFPELEYEMHRVGLTPDQVREYGLPSTPLKDTEHRAGRWQAAMGVAQTEIDSLAALQPDLLRRIATDALDQFFDRTLDQRVMEAKSRWLDEAQAVVDASIDGDAIQRLRDEAESRLDELQDEIDAINNTLRMDAGDFALPPADVPEANVTGGGGTHPLLDSRWSFAEQTRALNASKAYEVTS